MLGNKAEVLGVAINSNPEEELLKMMANLALGVKKKGELWDVSCEPALPAGRSGVTRLRRDFGGQGLVVFTPNPEFIVQAQKDHEFKKILNEADINLPDGVGLMLASRLLGKPIKERVSGADVVQKLLEVGNKKCEVGTRKWVIGIAGARRGEQSEAEELIRKLGEKYPNVNFVNLDNQDDLVNSKHEKISENSEYSENQNNRMIRLSDSQIFPNNRDSELYPSFLNAVFAAHGMGKQERWIMENKDRLEASVFMGVGGSLDFLTGFAVRAPKAVRAVGLEWLWRGLQKPRHFLRIWKAVFVFGFLIGKEIVKKRLLH